MRLNKLLVSFTVVVLSVSAIPYTLFAKTLPAGISKDQIWFSEDPFFVGDSITIHSLVFNSSNYRMQGTMTLKDGTTTIETRMFIVEGGGASQVVSFPWIVTTGNHSFSALIEKNEFTQGTSSVASSSVVANETAKVKRFADYDRNHNGVGDSTEPPPPPVPLLANVNTASTSGVSLPVDPVKSVERTITEEAPAPVVSVALPVIGTIESVRISQAQKAGRTLEKAESGIAAHNGTTTESLRNSYGSRTNTGWSMMKNGLTSGQVIRSPLDYLKLLVALILHFFTSNPYAFYVLFLLLLYKLIRIAIGLFR